MFFSMCNKTYFKNDIILTNFYKYIFNAFITVRGNNFQLISTTNNNFNNLQYQSKLIWRKNKTNRTLNWILWSANSSLCILGSHFLNWLPFSHGNNKSASCNNIKNKHEPPRKNKLGAHITFQNWAVSYNVFLIL